MRDNLGWAAVLAAVCVASGCNELVDTDRFRVGDGSVGSDDSGMDGGGDSGAEAGVDARVDDDAGVDAGVCADADADGSTTCDGDCDDDDALTFPGAAEVCGDERRNDCGAGVAEEGCGGMGTFVAPPPVGDDSNPGTQAMPVATVGGGISRALSIGSGRDVYVAAGTYVDDITVAEGVSLLGGFDTTTWTRDPRARETILVGSAAGLRVPGGVTRVTAVDGFTIRGPGSPLPLAAALTIDAGAEPTISNNEIRAGDSTETAVAIHVNPLGGANETASPLIRANQIHLSSGGPGTVDRGGWGIFALRTRIEIVDNVVNFAEGRTSQHGIELRGSPGTTVTGNRVRHPLGRAEHARGILLVDSGGEVARNDVVGGRAAATSFAVSVEGAGPRVALINNIIVGGESPDSIGLNIQPYPSGAAIPDVVVHSNFIDGGLGSTSGRTVGIRLDGPIAPVVVSRIFNNTVRSGLGDVRYAVAEEDSSVDAAAFQNNALHVDPGGSPTTSALYFDEGATRLVAISAVNALAGAMSNLDSHCMIVNPVVGGDFHLMGGSECIDAGTATEAPTVDFEGDPRSSGSAPDIGVDEIVP